MCQNSFRKLSDHASGEGPSSLQDDPIASKYQKNCVGSDAGAYKIDLGAKIHLIYGEN